MISMPLRTSLGVLGVLATLAGAGLASMLAFSSTGRRGVYVERVMSFQPGPEDKCVASVLLGSEFCEFEQAKAGHWHAVLCEDRMVTVEIAKVVTNGTAGLRIRRAWHNDQETTSQEWISAEKFTLGLGKSIASACQALSTEVECQHGGDDPGACSLEI